MLTPFEEFGTLTTRAQGEAFLASLAAATPVRLTSAGASVAGNPMTVATIGTGPVSVCVMGSIHGTEPAGREAIFKYLRNLAESADAGVLDYLTRATLSFIPTANPDRIDAGVRENLNGIDLNRDMVNLSQPEARALWSWLTGLQPVLLIDLHEASNSAVPDVATVHQVSTLIDPALRTRSAALRDAVTAALVAAGESVVEYPFANTIRGTVFTEAGITWKATGFGFETQRLAGKTLATRVAEQMIALSAAIEDHDTNLAAYSAAHTAAGGDVGTRRGAAAPAFL